MFNCIKGRENCSLMFEKEFNLKDDVYDTDFRNIVSMKFGEKERCSLLICLFSTSKHKNLFPSLYKNAGHYFNVKRTFLFSFFNRSSTYSFFIFEQRKLSSIHYIGITSHFLFSRIGVQVKYNFYIWGSTIKGFSSLDTPVKIFSQRR